MRISCPNCGERPLEEYTYRGDATLKRPESIDPSSIEQWVNYVYLRDNPKGRHHESWRHSSGCGAWLTVERDTVTHDIFSVTRAQDSLKQEPKS